MPGVEGSSPPICNQTQTLLTPNQTKIEVFEQVAGESNTPTFNAIKIESGKTALDLLSQTHQIKTKGEKENAFITTVDNRTANDARHEFWAFYVNGKQASVGAGSYHLQPGDKILWKIETY
jgi:hypothetical protein